MKRCGRASGGGNDRGIRKQSTNIRGNTVLTSNPSAPGMFAEKVTEKGVEENMILIVGNNTQTQ